MEPTSEWNTLPTRRRPTRKRSTGGCASRTKRMRASAGLRIAGVVVLAPPAAAVVGRHGRRRFNAPSGCCCVSSNCALNCSRRPAVAASLLPRAFG